MSRRDFLRYSLFGLGALAVPALAKSSIFKFNGPFYLFGDVTIETESSTYTYKPRHKMPEYSFTPIEHYYPKRTIPDLKRVKFMLVSE